MNEHNTYRNNIPREITEDNIKSYMESRYLNYYKNLVTNRNKVIQYILSKRKTRILTISMALNFMIIL